MGLKMLPHLRFNSRSYGRGFLQSSLWFENVRFCIFVTVFASLLLFLHLKNLSKFFDFLVVWDSPTDTCEFPDQDRCLFSPVWNKYLYLYLFSYSHFSIYICTICTYLYSYFYCQFSITLEYLASEYKALEYTAIHILFSFFSVHQWFTIIFIAIGGK